MTLRWISWVCLYGPLKPFVSLWYQSVSLAKVKMWAVCLQMQAAFSSDWGPRVIGSAGSIAVLSNRVKVCLDYSAGILRQFETPETSQRSRGPRWQHLPSCNHSALLLLCHTDRGFCCVAQCNCNDCKSNQCYNGIDLPGSQLPQRWSLFIAVSWCIAEGDNYISAGCRSQMPSIRIYLHCYHSPEVVFFPKCQLELGPILVPRLKA